jgi:protein O-mannosyl-transferase
MQVPMNQPSPNRARDWWVAAVLAGIAFAVFARALHYDFVTFDDPYYVFLNPHVYSGLTPDSIGWAFTSFENANWHPITWLSLQLDQTVWGPGPWGYHLTNVILHAANAGLLFLVLRALTGAFWRSVIVALLFAVHPLRVESVAWVTERKDVLSTFFGLVALWAYAVYARDPSARRYGAVAAAFALSLMSKPMLVTLPCLLLVLDWWPLGRVTVARDWARLVVEKLPLFALAAASIVLTYLAQMGEGVVVDLARYSAYARASNALVSYVQYLSMTFWPVGLAPYYPHPGDGLPVWKAAGAALLLAVVTAVAVALRRRSPFVLAGWLWYLGTLVPVIGLVQVGRQAYADRYTYFPQIGILLALCWGVAELATRRSRIALTVAAAAAAVGLIFVTEGQLKIWHDSVGLWNYTIKTAGRSPTALQSLARALEDVNTPEALKKARALYGEALELDPDSVLGHTNLGALLARLRDYDEATKELTTACNLDANYPLAHIFLGDVYYEQGKIDDCIREEETALRLDPRAYAAHWTMGQAEFALGHVDEAIDCYWQALSIRPHVAEVHNSLAIAMLARGDKEEAIDHLKTAIGINPHLGEPQYLLAKQMIAEGQNELAFTLLRQAVNCGPVPAEAHFLLGTQLANRGATKDAAVELSNAVFLNPKDAEAQYNLGMICIQLGEIDRGQACVEKALELNPNSDTYRIGLARILDGQAAATASEGNPSEAAALARRARDLAAKAGQTELVRVIEEQLRHYERGEAGRPAPKAAP